MTDNDKAFIQTVELALDFGFGVSEEDYKKYLELITTTKDKMEE